MKKILVVTATLGNRSTLERTISTVKNIGNDYVKHVIIAPQQAVFAIKQKYPYIECISENANSNGIFSALNQAFNLYGSNYDYLTFINDDDYWLPDFYYLIDSLQKDSSLDFVYGKVKFVDKNGVKIKNQSCSSQFYSFLPLLRNGIILLTQQATIIRSDYFFLIGGFDEKYKLVADTKFWIELSLLKPRYKYINRQCAAYTIQKGEQLSSDKNTQKVEQENILSSFSDIHVKGDYKILLWYRIVNILVYIKNMFLKYF